MKKIVIIGANCFQNPLILKAKEAGYETHVFAWKSGDIGEKTADYFYPVSIVEKEAILKSCKIIKPDAVVSIGSDLAVLTVNYIARNLGLPANSEECDRVTTNKYEMRKALQRAGIRTPKFVWVNDDNLNVTIENDTFPLIVKPTDRSGSRGITKVYSQKDLYPAIENAIDQSFQKAAIVEEYIEGDEYSCECISYKGHHHLLAITKKFTTGTPNYIEIGHMEPSGLPVEIQQKIKTEILRALTALKIQHGASHSEFKLLPSGDIRIIEIGARMGGDFIGSDLVNLSTGYDFLQMVLDVSLGKQPRIDAEHAPQVAAARFIMEKSEGDLLARVKRQNFRVEQESEVKEEDHQVIDSSSRLGSFIISAPLTRWQEMREILF